MTQAQWTAVMGPRPWGISGATLAAGTISWDAAMAFCQKLTEGERAAGRLPAGWQLTLPTEAQWEYACRAGTRGSYAGDLDAMAWYSDNNGSSGFGDPPQHPVGTKQPNAWGLFDMQGLISVWCLDWYADTLPGGAVTDPSGPASGRFFRVVRGGGGVAADCRSAYRGKGQADGTGGGMRLALSWSGVPATSEGLKVERKAGEASPVSSAHHYVLWTGIAATLLALTVFIRNLRR